MSSGGRGRWATGMLVWWAALTSASCTGVIEPDRASLELEVPVRVGFERVADAMQPSCGTLDCHGQAGRNLRLFGGRGLRLASTSTSADGTTSAPEYEANYWGVVALEPETIAAVVADGGSAPERLILVRKGRGTTRHKGGALMQPGDSLDRCLLAWLEGTILTDVCNIASKLGVASPL